MVTVFGLDPLRIGGVEAFARELSLQLGACGRRSVLCFLSEPPPFVRAFLDLPNVTIEVLPNSLQPAGAVPSVRRVLRRYAPEVLILQFTPFLSAIPWAARLAGVDRVYFVDQGSHAKGWNGEHPPRWKQRVAQLITAPVTGVISISDFNLKALQAHGFLAARKAVRIYNSTDVSRGYHPELGKVFRQSHGIPQDRFVAVQASWMIPEKGIPDLLEAVRLALPRCPTLHLLLAGEGPLRPHYQQQAIELGLEGRVTWTGLVRDPGGEGLFDAADVVCQLSRWEEAFGYVIAEGMAAERPVVATRVGAIPELVADGETGILVERGDSAAAAEAIVAFASNADLRRRMGEAGRIRALQYFDVKTNVAALLRFVGLS